MERGLQRVNHHSHLAEWDRRVETCRKSGRRVNEWRAEQGIPVSTYYSWRRKVFQAAVSKNEVCFAEAPVRAVAAETAACVQYGELRVDIHAGANTETIRPIIQALKSC